MSRTAYLCALALLVLNDHLLKFTWPGWVTGKLSDFAGVFVLAVFLAWILPRRIACVVAAVLFIWWKSPLSESFIRALPYETTRVIDWTDLWALSVLPLAYRASTPAPITKRAHAVIAGLSLVAFAATSPARVAIPIRQGDEMGDFATGLTVSQMRERAKRCGMTWVELGDHADVGVGWERWRPIWHNAEADAFGTADVANGTVRLHFTKIRVTFETYGNDDAYRLELRRRLRRCFHRHEVRLWGEG